MNSKKITPLRASGQSSIAFFSRSSNSARDFKEDSTDKGSKKDSGSRISLSDFLDRKLQKSSASAPFKTVQEKSKPFSSLVGAKEFVESAGGQSRDKKEGEGVAQKRKEGEGEGSGILDKVVFEQFKPGVTEKVDCTDPSSICEEGTPNTDDEAQNSRKRRNPFEIDENEHRARKPYIVLGDDPRVKQNDSKPKQRGRRDQPASNKKQRPLYNHYANGCGWWDGDMECVDDEELGYGEVWEGVGSTTLGEIVDWH
ncbi:hypothetical protein SLEP1_g11599 [Rubroshorea leprosula]|nr:hypothetical protein SLEP1_g11599 [Rubroshorea leprosula]